MAEKNEELNTGGDNSEAAELRATEANISAASSSDLAASGAFLEPAARDAVDVDALSVDNNPRAGTSVAQNQIDFNDPSVTAEATAAEDAKVDPAAATVRGTLTEAQRMGREETTQRSGRKG